MFGGLPTDPKAMWSPPIVSVWSGFHECSWNSDGQVRMRLDDHRPGRSAPVLAVDRRRRPRRAGRGPRRRGSSSRSRRGSAATRRGSTPARRPRRPRSGGSACAAGRTDAARGAGRVDRPSRPRPPRRPSSSPPAPSFPVRPYRVFQAPTATVPRATTARPRPIVCGRVSRSWSSSVASTTVLAGYIDVITATSDSSPSRVASR